MTLLRHAACLVLGVVVALADIALHRAAFPLGLLLVVVATFALPWRLLRSRRPRAAASYVVGWLALFAVVLPGRPEGDFAVAGDPASYALMVSGLGLFVVGLVSLTGGRRG